MNVSWVTCCGAGRASARARTSSRSKTTRPGRSPRRSTECSTPPVACANSASIAAPTSSTGCQTCVKPCWRGSATNYLGAVHVPLNTGYRGGLLQHAIALSDAKLMVTHASLLPRLAEVDTGQVRDVIVVGGEPPASFGTLRYHSAAALENPATAEPVTSCRALGHELHHLYVRHHRPLERRHLHLCAGLVGRRDGHGLFPRRRSRAREPAIVPRQWCGRRHGSPDQRRHVRAGRRLQAGKLLGHRTPVQCHRRVSGGGDDAIPAAATAVAIAIATIRCAMS